MNNFTVVV
jgi:hypothetical protein